MLTFLEGLNCIMMDRTSYQQLTSSCLSSFFTHHLEGSRIPGLPNSRTDDGDVSTCPSRTIIYAVITLPKAVLRISTEKGPVHVQR